MVIYMTKIQSVIDKNNKHPRNNLGRVSQITMVGGSTIEYFAISTRRLALFSILTLGIYEIYWFYKNWQAVKESERQKISPLGRTIFIIFYCNSLFRKVLESAKSHGYQSSYSPGWLATTYILFLLVGNGLSRMESSDVGLSLVWLVVAIFSFIPLLSIQKAINFNNEKIKGDSDLKRGFTGGEVVLIIIGLVWFLSFIWNIFISSDLDYSHNSAQTQGPTAQNVLWQADYQEGYKSGYTDGRAQQGQLMDSYGPPATEERREAYARGYFDGFLKGCREGNFDCSEVERIIDEGTNHSGTDVKLAPAGDI